MTTNSEWLNELAARGDGSLQAWFDAEHVESGPTNGIDGETNGIADGITLPDGDAVKELREFIDDQFVSGKTTWTQGMAIVDMVERDYVSRESIESVMDTDRELVAKNIRLTAERDELKAKLDVLKAHGVTVSEQFCGGYEVYNERKRQVDELTDELAKRDKGIARLKRQRDEARADFAACSGALAKCSREREAYRRACGELLDYADQMRLVRLDGCGAALADMDGEVVS